MRKMNAFLATAMAATLPVAGCATTHLSGDYSPHASGEISRRTERRLLAKGNEWLFFWGLLDSGSFDLDKELRSQLREDEVVTNLDVEDRLSVGGAFLWIITAGIVSHHSIVAEGEPAVVRAPAEKSAAGAVHERETIIVPAPPQPAGLPHSADYSEGLRDGQRDAAAGVSSENKARMERSADYLEGYRDGLKETPPR
jgi:hypothetical protein